MNPPPRTLLLLSFFLLCALSCTPVVSSEQNEVFEFPSFTLRNLTFLGDSYIRNGVVGLTRDTGVPSSSSGSFICNVPVRFFNPQTNSSASFSVRFSFEITNANPDNFGDGLTFFISPSNRTLGSPGRYLGLYNSSNPWDDKKILAVEFDTHLDDEFDDPNSNHVGLDLGSPKSIQTANAASCGINLRSGKLITAWIDYYNSRKTLLVSLSYSNFKPEKPLLSVEADLSQYFEELMYVGFSASTEGSTELHTVMDWSFQTFEFSSSDHRNKTSSPQPHNVSESSWNFIPTITVFPAQKSTHKSHKKLILGLGVPGPILLFIMCLTLGWYSTKKWKEIQTGRGRLAPELLKGPRKFSYREINCATKGFNYNKIVGHGAFGTVYKAVLPESGVTLAVKRSKHAHQSKSEFLSELTTIACLRHKNLLQLQGWCTEKGELLLVYDFMSNGSLDTVLHQEGGITLTWDQRYNIACGIASVLTYLHQECEQQVIHRDIKTSNIMLDVNFNPRLGDFGLARLMDHDKSPVSTLTAGTMGYLAPEYLQYGKATEKTDVFSFGVVILEVASGRKPIDRDHSNQKIVNLVDWVWGLYSEDKLIEAADSRLSGNFEKEEVIRLLLLGLSCANPDCTARPSMRRVLQILNHEAELLALPKKKPCLTFSPNLALTLDEIVSECNDGVI